MARIRKSETFDEIVISIIWKVALYIRLSREDGNDISISVENQKAELKAFLENFQEPYVLVDFYCDDGYTGTDSNRNNFQRLLSDIHSKKVDCVIVRDPSRLSRNYLEAGKYMEELFVQLNVRFISLSLPPLDSYKNPDAMNSIAVPIQNVINDDFCRQTSQKIRGVFNMKRSRGEFIGAFAPYGYQKSELNKNHLVIDPDAASIVKDIYTWFVFVGMSKGSIVRKLNELGIPNPTNYKHSKGMKYHCKETNNDGQWSPRTVASILCNEMYIGNMVQGKQRIKSYKVHDIINVPKNEWFIVENTHEPIIEKETFEKAQSLHQKDTRIAPQKNELSLFAGFLKCADCGKGMRRSTGKNKVYYSCRTNSTKSLQACTRHSIREDVLEEALLKTFQVQVALIDNLKTIIEEVGNLSNTNKKSDTLEKILQTKKSSLSKALITMDSLYMDWKTNEISHEDYLRMKNTFETTVESLRKDIQTLEKEILQAIVSENQDTFDFNTFSKYKNIQKLDRAILVCLVDKILIHEDKHITIIFNYEDQQMRVLKLFQEELMQSKST